MHIKLIKEAFDERECEKFEMALQNISKLCVYKELKQVVGVEEYLEYVKGPPSRLFFKFCSGTHGFFEEWGRHAKRGGSQECPNFGLERNLLSTSFLSAHHTIPKDKTSWTIPSKFLIRKHSKLLIRAAFFIKHCSNHVVIKTMYDGFYTPMTIS